MIALHHLVKTYGKFTAVFLRLTGGGALQEIDEIV